MHTLKPVTVAWWCERQESAVTEIERMTCDNIAPQSDHKHNPLIDRAEWESLQELYNVTENDLLVTRAERSRAHQKLAALRTKYDAHSEAYVVVDKERVKLQGWIDDGVERITLVRAERDMAKSRYDTLRRGGG